MAAQKRKKKLFAEILWRTNPTPTNQDSQLS